jgi:hypothetical protein
LRDLVTLERSSLDEREYAALSWARAFLTHPEGIPSDIQEEYELAFIREERAAIEAAIKGMFCTNLAVNTERYLLARIKGRCSSEVPAACELPPVE